MSELRDELYAGGRMTFPADKKVVRPMGGALSLVSAVSSKDIALPPEEVPFVGHTALLVVHRRSDDVVADWYRNEWAGRVVDVDGVHGVATFELDAPGEQFDLVYFEGDPVLQTEAIRAAAPHHDRVIVLADAPFLLINPLDYPWAEAIRSSSLPKTVASGGS